MENLTSITPREWFKKTFKRIPATGCQEFRHSIANKNGYPQIKRGSKVHLYTRYLWEKLHGKISSGLILRHKCDNPRCVNLDHLQLGTHADNVSDRVARDRGAKGEKNGRAKLTETEVREILTLQGSQNSIAKRYGVDRKSIACILSGKTWKHLTKGSPYKSIMKVTA